MKIGIVSGYFNPLHYGHIEYIEAAKKLSNRLICIVNSDYQVTLKGSKTFLSEDHRLKIMASLRAVDEVLLSVDKDKTVRESLKRLREKYPKDELTFYNSGDRKGNNIELSETDVCRNNNIHTAVLDLPKIYSSSELLKKI